MKLRLVGSLHALIMFSAFAVPVAAAPGDAFIPGTRTGPFVATEMTLSDLTKDGYEIKGNLGSSLILQKGASIYSCQIPPDPEHLSYKPYFVCSELSEIQNEKSEPKPAEQERLKPIPGGMQTR
ncbi:MAG: hypothetical protein GC184_13185 [Rhizobiales bacterium]|nr:hypothetical protein [Hyphomicrobiales bacterium]